MTSAAVRAAQKSCKFLRKTGPLCTMKRRSLQGAFFCGMITAVHDPRTSGSPVFPDRPHWKVALS